MDQSNNIPIVDEWKPLPNEIIFTHSKNIISAPLAAYFHLDDQNNKINYFMVNPKKSYNSEDLRDHFCLYVNYFERFFDPELEYFTNLANIKFLIDCYIDSFTTDNLIGNIVRYILQPSIFNKVVAMVERNYSLSLSYKSINNPQLQYTDEHAKALMGMSILMNLCIPIATHYAYMKRISDIDEFLLDIFDFILYAPPYQNINIPAKLYKTAISNVVKNEKNNASIWIKQDIRGKDTITHSMGAVRNIVLNIMPKYSFDKSMVSLNYTSIQKSNKYQVTDIGYEYNYIPLSSSKRDGEDNSSDMDKYESNLIKTSEALYLQSKFNCQYTMQKIEAQWGPFNEDEIAFYLKELKDENGEIMNGFQMQLIFNMFYKYFGDCISIRGINYIDYIKLMLIEKKMLQNSMMGYLPYVISAKVEKIVARKTLNKKEMEQMQRSQYYPLVCDKYKNDKIIKQILSTIATIITSTFRIIDFYDKDLHGKEINIESGIIIEECLLYVLLI